MLYLTPAITAALLALAVVLGAVLGSFVNCAAWRLVHGGSVLHGRSRCAHCGHTLAARDLVPVLSYLFLRGRCRYCGQPVSPRYPVTELLGAAAFASLLLRFDVSWQCLRFWWLAALLLLAALVDYEDGWIPDRVCVLAAVGYLPLAWLEGGFPLLLGGLVGALALGIPMLAIVLVMEKILKTEAMGGGDLKLFAVLGLYFGWQQGLFLVPVSCVLGLGHMALAGRLHRRTATPFGPALCLAAWVTALVGEPVVNWYLSLF